MNGLSTSFFISSLLTNGSCSFPVADMRHALPSLLIPALCHEHSFGSDGSVASEEFVCVHVCVCLWGEYVSREHGLIPAVARPFALLPSAALAAPDSFSAQIIGSRIRGRAIRRQSWAQGSVSQRRC